MCLGIDDRTMINWLRAQVRVIEAWREELVTRCELDIQVLTCLETHYAWLTGEIIRLEDSSHHAPQQAARLPKAGP